MPDKQFPKHYYPFWWLLLAFSRLPFPVLYLFSDFLFFVLYRLTGYRKKVVRQNLERSFPEKTASEIDRLVPAFYRNLCDVIVETLKMATIPAAELHKRVTFPNPEVAFEHLEAGKPVIVLGSHLANWEWALSGAAVHFSFPADGVYKPLSNSFFEKFMLHTRTRLGAHLFPMKETLRDFIRRQKIPRLISLLSDQTPPKSEIQYWNTFLNQDTGFYVGADKLAASFHYPVIFVGAKRVKRGYYAYGFEAIYDGISPLREHEVTERYARILERWIRENPADYLWSHRRWKHKRPELQKTPFAAESGIKK